jgi:hypothetical protein
MRNTKTFEIEGCGKTFIVKELKVKEILSLMSGDLLEDTSIDALKKNFSDVLLPMCSNIEISDLEEMTPSELEVVWEHFREANKSFFGMARKMGLGEMVENIKQGMIMDFGRTVAPSSKQVTQVS